MKLKQIFLASSCALLLSGGAMAGSETSCQVTTNGGSCTTPGLIIPARIKAVALLNMGDRTSATFTVKNVFTGATLYSKTLTRGASTFTYIPATVSQKAIYGKVTSVKFYADGGDSIHNSNDHKASIKIYYL